MTFRAVAAAWNDFFFTPQLPTPICLFRILYGLALTATVLLLRPEWFAWYGVHSWVSLATMHQIEPGPRLDLFNILPPGDAWTNSLFWLAVLAALLLTLGLFTRGAAIASFLCIVSLHQRNIFINHGGDTFLRVAGFFLMFAPAGAAFSLDRFLRVRRGLPAPVLPSAPWAQRMIQFELALCYFMSFWWKSLGSTWVNGTALLYVVQLEELRRFPVPPWLQSPVILKVGAWFTLALEFGLGTLIWIKEFRYPLLALGVLFHLSLEYSLNIPLFQWDILTGYALFIDPADLSRAGRWFRQFTLRIKIRPLNTYFLACSTSNTDKLIRADGLGSREIG